MSQWGATTAISPARHQNTTALSHAEQSINTPSLYSTWRWVGGMSHYYQMTTSKVRWQSSVSTANGYGLDNSNDIKYIYLPNSFYVYYNILGENSAS